MYKIRVSTYSESKLTSHNASQILIKYSDLFKGTPKQFFDHTLAQELAQLDSRWPKAIQKLGKNLTSELIGT